MTIPKLVHTLARAIVFIVSICSRGFAAAVAAAFATPAQSGFKALLQASVQAGSPPGPGSRRICWIPMCIVQCQSARSDGALKLERHASAPWPGPAPIFPGARDCPSAPTRRRHSGVMAALIAPKSTPSPSSRRSIEFCLRSSVSSDNENLRPLRFRLAAGPAGLGRACTRPLLV